MKLYHGTPDQLTVVTENSFVTPMLTRAAKYARYRNNREGVDRGYIYELEAGQDDVVWDKRDDCIQGRLKHASRALCYAVCDIPLDLINRESPIRIRPDGSAYWNGDGSKSKIVWIPIP
jgi:hypothetical protein